MKSPDDNRYDESSVDSLNMSWEELKAKILRGEITDILEIEGFLTDLEFALAWTDVQDVLENESSGTYFELGKLLISRIIDLRMEVVMEIAENENIRFGKIYARYALNVLSDKNGGFLLEDIPMYLMENDCVEDYVLEQLREPVLLEQVDWFLGVENVPHHLRICLLKRMSSEVLPSFLDKYLDDETKELLESRLDVTEKERQKNVKIVNAFQMEQIKAPWKGFEDLMPKGALNAYEELRDKRILNFYIRVENISNDWQFVLEILFHLTEIYIEKLALFTDIRILPRRDGEKFSLFIRKEFITRGMGKQFIQNSICNANMIHFSHGKSGESVDGSRPLLCPDITSSSVLDEDGPKNFNNTYSELGFSARKDEQIDIIKELNELVQIFFVDLERFQSETIREAKAHFKKHKKEIEEEEDSE